MRIAFGLVALFALVIGSGCVTTSLGRPPSDNALINDGSPAAMEKLQKRYSIAYGEGLIARPGATPEEVSSEMNFDVDQVNAPAWSDEAADYFASSELASDATDSTAVGFDRFAHSGTPPLIIQAGGVLVGGALGIITYVVNPPESAGESGILLVDNVATQVFNGMFIGLVAAIPVVMVYQWTVPTLSASLAAPDYRKGVRAYNKELDLRIRKQAQPKSAPPPPPTEPPTPGASETSPGG